MADARDPVTDAIEAAMTELFRLAGSRRVHTDRQRRSRTSLSRTEWELLRRVDDLGPLRVRRLAELVDLSPAVTSRALAALEGDGLVVRGGTPDDRRAVTFRTSPKGARTRARFQATMYDELDAVLAGWSARDSATLARLFPRLIDDLRGLNDRAAPAWWSSAGRSQANGWSADRGRDAEFPIVQDRSGRGGG